MNKFIFLSLFFGFFANAQSPASENLLLLGKGVFNPSSNQTIAFVCGDTSCTYGTFNLFSTDSRVELGDPIKLPKTSIPELFSESVNSYFKLFFAVQLWQKDEALSEVFSFNHFSQASFTDKDGFNWSIQPEIISLGSFNAIISLLTGPKINRISDKKFQRALRRAADEQGILRVLGVDFPVWVTKTPGAFAVGGSFYLKNNMRQN